MTGTLPDQHDTWDDLELYALGMLDGDDALAVERLLAADPAARERLAELRGVVATLALEVEPMAPPPGLRDRILIAAREADVAAVSGFDDGRSERAVSPIPIDTRRAPRSTLPWAVAALLAVALVASVVWAFSLRDDTIGTPDIVAHQVAATGGEGIAGELIVIRNASTAILSLAGLEPIGQDRTYQVWLIEGEQPVPNSTFRPDEQRFASVVIAIPGDIDRYDLLAVTVEPNGGSSLPTSEPLVVSDLTQPAP